METRKFKMLVLTVLFIVPLMLVTANSVNCGPNPPICAPDTEHVVHGQGPAIIADLLIIPMPDNNDLDDGSIWVTITGNCKGQPVSASVELEAHAFNDVLTAADLQDYRLNNFGPFAYDCLPKDSPGDIIINTVVNFDRSETADLVTAKVVLLWAVDDCKLIHPIP